MMLAEQFARRAIFRACFQGRAFSFDAEDPGLAVAWNRRGLLGPQSCEQGGPLPQVATPVTGDIDSV